VTLVVFALGCPAIAFAPSRAALAQLGYIEHGEYVPGIRYAGYGGGTEYGAYGGGTDCAEHAGGTAHGEHARSGELAGIVDAAWCGLAAEEDVRRLPPVDQACFLSELPEASPACRPALCDRFRLDGLARGYYLNDQRIQWTGVEGTFGVEAIVAPSIECSCGGWDVGVEGEFYLNQPFDRNVLTATPELASYQGNFEADTIEISQLVLSVRRNNLLVAVGKMTTPFGRTHFPLLTNARLDAPFLRTESILWRETGALLRYQPGWFVADVALVNGAEDRDTNSSKGIISRVGIEAESWCVGASIKWQDGIGSDSQKIFDNHVGVDGMVRRGRFTLSGEAIYDEYGFRQPGFDPLDITWGRSIYYRDLNYRTNVPITGVGYYVNLGFEGDRWEGCLNYGEFYPQKLGHPQHDVTHRRGIVKAVYHCSAHLQLYSVVMIENDGYVAQCGRPRRGTVVLAGLQWVL